MFVFFLGFGQDSGSVGKLGLLSNSVVRSEFSLPQDFEIWLSRDWKGKNVEIAQMC